MTLTQPPDELEALIDLLVDTEREMTPDAPATALSHAAVVQPEQSSEVFMCSLLVGSYAPHHSSSSVRIRCRLCCRSILR